MFQHYDDVVTIEDLMEMLDIGRNKAYALLQSGQIKSFKVGKSYRIPKICIQNYVLAKVQIQIEAYKQQN
ncbi:helix-turn-helix domain-containing protein [Bacillus toyonensis]|uniref:helix-turn-helix domain-containing protein n=1 Tax=Bacillus toyonensis TaxID=155322 RepID=UPI00027955DA|nr:helix-turn-helix domain-containing protein [Bacillus toyonensis]MDP9744701.1 excisionase family DNA binding protein [Bacillus thuringiensis]EJQ91282.1 excisionase family DNA binding domain-containing protein [Bacillus toyonensis]HDR7223709.1 helix-turn-helix domain-containing protein [Bacillus toyonensis]HDR7346740.1 helix-turn-helix domain-containing protein [Bacillus toyonensis]HDR7397237.1 helix-turn-helix domain-containing protein [Bacillus toyonensis]